MNTVRGRLAVFVSVVIASLAAPAATADPAPPSTLAPSIMVLSISDGEHVRPGARRVLLRCHPTGGDHPNAATACRELASGAGSFAALRVHPDRPCILLYNPVTVTASGTWHNEPVNYRETFGNSCRLHAETGAVFRF